MAHLIAILAEMNQLDPEHDLSGRGITIDHYATAHEAFVKGSYVECMNMVRRIILKDDSLSNHLRAKSMLLLAQVVPPTQTFDCITRTIDFCDKLCSENIETWRTNRVRRIAAEIQNIGGFGGWADIRKAEMRRKGEVKKLASKMARKANRKSKGKKGEKSKKPREDEEATEAEDDSGDEEMLVAMGQQSAQDENGEPDDEPEVFGYEG